MKAAWIALAMEVGVERPAKLIELITCEYPSITTVNDPDNNSSCAWVSVIFAPRR